MINPLRISRITQGIIVAAGLLFFRPLAYFAAIMMIFDGLTGICFLDKMYSEIFYRYKLKSEKKEK